MRRLLLPFSWLYGLIVLVRNKAFDWGVLREERFGIPVVAVGNLNVGGTGKSPTVLHLAGLLKNRYKIAILSRGYGRSTRGFHLVTRETPWREAGDEPLQYAMQLDHVTVAVCESRREGIRRLLSHDPGINLVLLDDAYQHRYVMPDCRILLTTYARPWYDDNLLPAGRLREPASASRRADIVVVTKCPVLPGPVERESFSRKLGLKPVQELFFSSIRYRETLSGLYGEVTSVSELKSKSVLLFCGIADPSPLLSWVMEHAGSVEMKQFADHHDFTVSDLVQLRKSFDRLSQKGPACMITTRKDAMRLQESESRTHLVSLPVWIADMETEFSPMGNRNFDEAVLSRVRRNS